MSAIDIALPRLKLEEGYRKHYYKDTLGFLTIGYGLNLDAGMSEPLAATILEWFVENTYSQISGYDWYQACDEVRQSVLIDLAFNMGLAKLLGFQHMLAACKVQDWGTAADELQNSTWFTQVGTRGPALVALLRNGA
jgi:lysozyme